MPEGEGLKRREVVKAMVIHQGKGLLLWDYHAKLWELPGGGKKPGETDEQTLKRETMEEAGLEVKMLNLIGTWEYPVPRTGFLLIGKTYLCKAITTNVKLEDPESQHSEFKWVTREEANKMELIPWVKQAASQI